MEILVRFTSRRDWAVPNARGLCYEINYSTGTYVNRALPMSGGYNNSRHLWACWGHFPVPCTELFRATDGIKSASMLSATICLAKNFKLADYSRCHGWTFTIDLWQQSKLIFIKVSDDADVDSKACTLTIKLKGWPSNHSGGTAQLHEMRG